MNEKENGVITPPENQVNKKRKWNFIIGGILVLLAIAIGLFIGYQKLNSNPVAIYKNAINGVYDILKDSLDELEKNTIKEVDVNKPIELDLTAKLESNMEQLKNFSGLNYHVNMGLDYNKKLANINLGIAEENSKLIDVLISAIDKNLYIKSDDLFDKVVSIGEYDIFKELSLEELETTKINVNYNDLDYVLKKMKTIIIESLDKDKFVLEEESIKIMLKKSLII